jgi:biopolymer transport protein ExbB
MFSTISAIKDQLSATPVVASAVESVWKFFAVGGPFMLAIIACSLVALAVIVFKFRTLTRERVVPEKLAREVERLEELLGAGSLGELENEFRGGNTSLARLCALALRKSDLPRSEVQGVVEATAREEVVKLNSGLPVLEVIINIAPLLGLLGTASGLALVFRDLGATANHAEIARGIFMALSTTIVGLAVAVPSVIAHSHFSRKIETMAARLEVLLTNVIAATHGKSETTPPAQSVAQA